MRLMTDAASQQLASVGAKATQTLSKVGGAAANAISAATVGLFAGLSFAMAAGAVSAVKFQNEFANVKKTMSDIEDPEVFGKIQEDLVKLATQIPITAGELAGIASVGGQLGIGADDITEFTEVVAKLGGATNMSSEQAATSMARFLNVTNENIDSIGKYSSVLVELGNNVAAQEGEIILLAQNFGASGNLAGLATEEILAFSAAMKETGQQSQAGATALSKLFLNITDAAKLGGDEMATFAQVAGQDVDEFRRLIETDVGQAVQILLAGLNKMGDEGRSTTAVLQEMGLGTVRVRKAILSLANNEEGLAEAMSRAKAEVIDQNALNEEAAEKFGTVAMQMQQFKSTMGAASITLGQVFLPIMEKLAGILVGVANAFFGLAEFFRDYPAAWWTTFAASFVAMSLGLLKMGKALTGPKGVITSMLKFVGITGGVGLVIAGVVAALGLAAAAYGKYKRELEEVQDVQEGVSKTIEGMSISLAEGFKAEPVDADTWEEFVTNLPEAVRNSVIKGVEEGTMDQDLFNNLITNAETLGPEFGVAIRDALDIGEGFFGGDFIPEDSETIQQLIGMIEGAGLGEQLAGTVTLLEEYNKLIFQGNRADKDRLAIVKDLLTTQMSIVDGVFIEKEVRDKEISAALNEHFGIQVKTDKRLRDMMSTEAGRVKLAKELAKDSKKFRDLIYDTADGVEEIVEETEEVESNLDSLLRITRDFRTKIDNLFNPIKEQFEMQKNERDLQKAHKEHADLHQEQLDLTNEDVALQQELVDLGSQEVTNAEEKLEMQELENEALEIEERIRTGMALTANEQLRKEKLKKDLVRVNAAAAHGSLEFAELEAKAIQEQIDEIDGKAVTQAQADELRAQALDIAENAQLRRQEEIATIEERRIEIGERLKEIPNDILDAHEDIHTLQRDLVNNTLDMIEAQAKFNTIKEEELRLTAQLLGMDNQRIDGLMTLMNHARVESGPLGQGRVDYLLQNIPAIAELLGYTPGNSVTGSQLSGLYNEYSRIGGGYAQMKPTYRHMGGSFKPGQNYVVGEYGPEMMKAFPGGGGQITPMGDSRGDTTNYVTLNVTGLPSDPIAARRTAQTIQKELNKLKSDGRSGVIR